MKQVTTITLTFKLPHKSGDTSIQYVRNLINKLRDHDCDWEVEVITNDDTNDFTFVKHDGKYSHHPRQRRWKMRVPHFRKARWEILASSKTEEVEDDEQKE